MKHAAASSFLSLSVTNTVNAVVVFVAAVVEVVALTIAFYLLLLLLSIVSKQLLTTSKSSMLPTAYNTSSVFCCSRIYVRECLKKNKYCNCMI